jgi:hypothetical protein
MDILELECPKILHLINNETESKIEGVYTGTVLRGGYRYKVIDQTIAVKECSTWESVHLLFEKFRFFPMCTLGAGLYVKGVISYSTSASLSLPIAILGMLIMVKEGIDFTIKFYNSDHLFQHISPDLIAQFRAETNESNFLQFTGSTCKSQMANLLTTFTHTEVERLFEKSMKSYKFSELLQKVGFDLAYKLAPKNKLIKSLNSEFELDLSLEMFKRNKESIKLLAGTSRLKPFLELLNA